MDKTFVCPCGLTCCDCLFYKAEIYAAASKLRTLIKESQLDIFLGLISKPESWNAMAQHLGEDGNELGQYFKPFRKMSDFLEVLDSLIKIQCKSTCQEAGGCSMGGVTRECLALKCIKSKGYDGCWDCSETKGCEKLKFLKRGYEETIEGNLGVIKEKGLNAVISRGNKYYAWQRE
jgi:hypothetical protein